MTAASSFFSLAVLYLLTLSSALGAHVPRAISPIITEPNGMAIWTLGSVETVEWITDGLDLDGVQGTVLLGYAHTDGSIMLWKDQPLAENVTLADGAVNVRCPLNLPTTLRYVVALLGDENNISPIFEIEDVQNPVPTSGSMSYSATLQTAGNVPSATLTHTSIVATIPPSNSTSSSALKTSSKTSSSNSVTITSAQGTATGKPDSNGSDNSALDRLSALNSGSLLISAGLSALVSVILL
ncbi:hypothetical protein ONZ51_g8858 [Trametes cubensis]|uniref:Uncharacterized protein n=1 Tax=Trametes cubensis TaxID=1111947 RepID=A0AAD7X8A3_9APHY|nr:hypothetical protein ONZ51_g8858 [Trametes cubensis]